MTLQSRILQHRGTPSRTSFRGMLPVWRSGWRRMLESVSGSG